MSEDKVERTSEIYEWINEDYIGKILKEFEKNDNAKIVHFHVAHATAKGDNYVGALFRVNVEYQLNEPSNNKTISMIIKANIEDDSQLSEILEEFNVFQRESQVYKFILNECTKLLKSINDLTIIGPSLIYADERSIVMKDLSVCGYKLKDCKKRLNLDECKRVLEKVAKYHACTAILNEMTPQLFKYHRQGNISEKFNPYHLVYQNTIQNCIRYVQTIPELQQYVEKLEKFAERIIPALINVYSIDSTETITVLNHGDLWINNLLFNDQDDVILLDYQEGYFGSPGIDLNWFIYTSCNQEILSNNLNELLEYYHKVLTDTLKALSYSKKIPTLEDIKNEIRKKSDHGLVTLLCMIPILIMENKEYAEARYIISDDEESEQIRGKIFNNDAYGKLLKDNLPYFIENGLL